MANSNIEPTSIISGVQDITSSLKGGGKSFTATKDCIIRLYNAGGSAKAYLNYLIDEISFSNAGSAGTNTTNAVVEFVPLRAGSTLKMNPNYPYEVTQTFKATLM